MQRRTAWLVLAILLLGGVACVWAGATSLRDASHPLGYREDVSRFFSMGVMPVSDGRFVVYADVPDLGGEVRMGVYDSRTGDLGRMDAATSARFAPAVGPTFQRIGRLVDDGRVVVRDGVLDLATGAARDAPWPDDFEPLVVAGPLVHGRNATGGLTFNLDEGTARPLALPDPAADCLQFEGPIRAATRTHLIVHACDAEAQEVRSYILEVATGRTTPFLDPGIAGLATSFVAGTPDHFVAVLDTAEAGTYNVAFLDGAGTVVDEQTVKLASATPVTFSAHGDAWALTALDLGASQLEVHWGERGAQPRSAVVGPGYFFSAIVVTAEPTEGGLLLMDGADVVLAHPGEGRWPWLAPMAGGATLALAAGAVAWRGLPRRLPGSGKGTTCPGCGAPFAGLAFCARCGRDNKSP